MSDNNSTPTADNNSTPTHPLMQQLSEQLDTDWGYSNIAFSMESMMADLTKFGQALAEELSNTTDDQCSVEDRPF